MFSTSPLEIVDVEVGTVDRWRHPGRPGGDHHAGATVQELSRLARQIDADVDREVPEPKHRASRRARGPRARSPRSARARGRSRSAAGGGSVLWESPASCSSRPTRLSTARSVSSILDLWNHDAVELGADHRLDVSFHQIRVNAVDPHDDGDVPRGRWGGRRVLRPEPRSSPRSRPRPRGRARSRRRRTLRPSRGDGHGCLVQRAESGGSVSPS